jgi:protein gp37
MKNTIEERRTKGLFWDRAWKIVEGCSKVSPGCDNCWSETETVMRCGHPNEKIRTRALMVTAHADSDGAPVNQDRFTGRITMRYDNLDLPLRTRKPTVFAIWNDLYHEDVPDSFRDRAYAVMALCPQHTFLVLTKRAERMADYWSTPRTDLGLRIWKASPHTKNGKRVPAVDCGRFQTDGISGVWHGVTCENQQTADERIPHLLRVPGKRFVSLEPMLGPIDMENVDPMPQFPHEDILYSLDCLRGHLKGPDDMLGVSIDAVLLGGESGKNARPMYPNWARSVQDQCEAAGVPFYFKQWGEWVPILVGQYGDTDTMFGNYRRLTLSPAGEILEYNGIYDGKPENWKMARIGKKKAGRTLDGRLHDDLAWDKEKVNA